MKCVYKELQMLKAMCPDKYFLCFENVRQHMQSRHSEDFTLIPNVINIIKLVAVNHATSSPAEKKNY